MPAFPELERLKSWWQRERQATRERFRQERRNLAFSERVQRGLALDQLQVSDADVVAGGRVRLWLESRKPVDWDDVRLGNGEPVCLWWQDPEEPEAQRAGVSRARDKLAVVVDGEVPERLWDGGFRLDREAPESTFDRGDRALARRAAHERGPDSRQALSPGGGR